MGEEIRVIDRTGLVGNAKGRDSCESILVFWRAVLKRISRQYRRRFYIENSRIRIGKVRGLLRKWL